MEEENKLVAGNFFSRDEFDTDAEAKRSRMSDVQKRREYIYIHAK